MNLISRDAVIAASTYAGLRNGQVGLLISKLLIHCVMLCPVIDAVKVVHGQWINKSTPFNPRVECSVCNHIYWNYGVESFNYCPNCGAKMDGVT